MAESYKPHAVCVPFPAQGHINPMLKLSNLLHSRGFFVTFVNTDYNHRRLLKSGGGPVGSPDFRFATIPDGLPPSESEDSTQDIPSLCDSTSKTCLEPFCNLLTELNTSASEAGVPPVSCIVADGIMSFTLKAAEALRLPAVVFWTTSACGFLAYTHYKYLVEKGYIPLKDMNQITDGYLETTLDEIPGMKRIRLKDFPSFIRTTDPEDFMLNFAIQQTHVSHRATAIILNTFDALEQDTLHALSAAYAPLPIYTIGPLINHTTTTQAAASLWKEDHSCIEWLDAQHPGSVLYVNFGSITVVTRQQLAEFAWGLADSRKPFLWCVRPDAVEGSGAALPPEFTAEVRDRGVVVGWAPQERVLKHQSIGGFLTHCGWNSTIESIANGGLPLIGWPFFAEQQTNCRYSCVEWGIGFEIDNDVKRADVAAAVRELMDGDKVKKMKERAVELKRKAEEATAPGGSSSVNLDKLIKDVLLR
ncbi:hypothetical protein ABFS82_02G058200 [Erythranthe guttata]|uniref:Glycosyltransferase n=1 Tax=Erythranthe guttata TaxID=4155 RepID=A0A022PSK4_ERYGU|nr:PREDICTED: 7-deoxyloganetin glucosyltransferase-like [Erythranthe guttata]EYU18464.1 hypothetical protein MIMGU_mgv1a005689mg [Erythranthe guttata]|eukprot:XP_012828429.1 PREDICTED: 7-deoxyloganetin glucosyltransferase-like [Erythranthe guttata]